MKRLILGNDELWNKTNLVLLHILSRGMNATEKSSIVLASLISILSTPLTWPVIIIKRLFHLIIFVVFLVFISESLMEFPGLKELIIPISLVAIFYRDLYQQLSEILIFILILLSAGAFMRWLCDGYLNNHPLRQQWLSSIEMEPVVASFVPVLPSNFQNDYDHVMDLYFKSNEDGVENELNGFIKKYWDSHS